MVYLQSSRKWVCNYKLQEALRGQGRSESVWLSWEGFVWLFLQRMRLNSTRFGR